LILAEKTRALIVDDDASMARYLSTYLSCHNFDVNNVGSGEEAGRMFRCTTPPWSCSTSP
jgi:DNA-binding response OmpR family regulator